MLKEVMRAVWVATIVIPDTKGCPFCIGGRGSPEGKLRDEYTHGVEGRMVTGLGLWFLKVTDRGGPASPTVSHPKSISGTDGTIASRPVPLTGTENSASASALPLGTVTARLAVRVIGQLAGANP